MMGVVGHEVNGGTARRWLGHERREWDAGLTDELFDRSTSEAA